MPIGEQDSGVTAGVKFVTSTIGNTVGGLTNLVGGVVGAASRGLGETIEGATGSAGKAVGRSIADAGTGIEDGSHRIAKGVKDAGYGKWEDMKHEGTLGYGKFAHSRLQVGIHPALGHGHCSLPASWNIFSASCKDQQLQASNADLTQKQLSLGDAVTSKVPGLVFLRKSNTHNLVLWNMAWPETANEKSKILPVSQVIS
jgi:hypothetical protein